MIGYFFLLVALTLYFTPYKKWSILLFLIFAMQGLRLIPDDLLGSKYLDLAFIYMIVIGTYSSFYEEDDIAYYLPNLSKGVWLLLLFLFSSAAFSLLHYGFEPIQILQGGRHLFLFASYFILKKAKSDDIKFILRALYYVTIIHAALFILQCFTHLPLLGISAEDAFNNATGTYRYHNYPQLMPFYLLISLLYPHLLEKNYDKMSISIFIIAIFSTQGRTYIIMNALICCFGFLMRGHLTRLIQWTLIGGIIALPFLDSVANRFTEDDTESDITMILSGRFLDYAESGKGDSGNLTFRFAWVAERLAYIAKRPLGEKIYGLGMISDSQHDVVNKKYHFRIGLKNENKDTIQLGTGDIAWGNFLSQFGVGGTILLLFLWGSLFFYLFKLRHIDPYITCGSLFLILQFFNSIADSHLSNTGNMAFPMLLCAYALDLYIYEDDEHTYNSDENFEMI